MRSDSFLREVFPDAPTVSFRRAPTLNDKLVKSHLTSALPKTWLNMRTGNNKWGNCNHCANMINAKHFTDVTSGCGYDIESFINCNTTFVVYRLECPCGRFYIGGPKRKLKVRLAEHKHAIRTGNPQYPMTLHYKEYNHSSCNTLKISGIEHVASSVRGGDRLKRLLQRESFWIYTLKATQYPGLNGELNFYPFL